MPPTPAPPTGWFLRLALWAGGAVLAGCALLTGCAVPEVRTSDARAPALPERTPDESPRAERAEPLQLELIDDFNPPRPSPTEVIDAPGARWDTALGGLSGLQFDRASGTLYAISDLPRRFDARLYTFGVELTDTALRVEPTAVFTLHEPASSERERIEYLDAESITSDGHGAFYVGTENGDDRPNGSTPRILRMNPDGLLTGELALPAAYLPAPGGPARGTRSNRAFEGMALSPSGRWLTAIVESSLRQDGEEANFEHGSIVRLLRWDLNTPGEPAEYTYPIEPLPRPPHGTPTGGNNGVSELVSLDDRRHLVMERAYVPLAEGQGPITIRIFEIHIPEQAAAGGAPRQLDKRLVLDLGDIVQRLEPGAQSLDNMEGMTLGPDLPSGDASLLLVSDDNFKNEQRTLFLALRVKRAP